MKLLGGWKHQGIKESFSTFDLMKTLSNLSNILFRTLFWRFKTKSHKLEDFRMTTAVEQGSVLCLHR